MVHHEDDARLRADAGEAGLVGDPHTHPVEETRGLPRQPVSDPEVRVSVEGGDDLPGVPLDLRHHDVPGHVVLSRAGTRGLQDPGVVHQPVDQDLALRQREGVDFEVKAFADLLDEPVHPAAQEPADAGDEEPLEGRPCRKKQEDDGEPEGECDVPGHPLAPPRSVYCESGCYIML